METQKANKLSFFTFVSFSSFLKAQDANINSVDFFIDESLEDTELIQAGLANQDAGSAFHLFSHGRSGELLIEGLWKNPTQIKSWLLEKNFTFQNKQLNIYSCNFAKGEKGEAAVSYLESALGVSVAASNDITGKDGDWELEVGHSYSVIQVENYSYSLQIIASDNFSTGDGTGGTGWNGDWTFSGETSVVGGELFMDGGNPSDIATRSVDLSGYPGAILSLYGRCEDSSSGFESSDTIWIEISTDGGSNFTTLWSRSGSYICPDANDAYQVPTGLLVLPVGNANTILRLRGEALSSSEDFYWDNIEIVVHDPCDATISGNADNDGDNISDICDLDDDNDGILDTDEYTGTPEYADWTLNTDSGTGTFSCSEGPDFTFNATNYNTVVIDNSETFDDDQQSFESFFGQADGEENINIRAIKNSENADQVIPIVSYTTLTINFDNSTPIGSWAFSIHDIDVDQLQISALDASNNVVSNTVITSWLQQVFDANPTDYGVNIPFWDETNAALVGNSDLDGLYNTVTQQSVIDEEAPGAWFMPNVSLNQLTLTFSPFGSSNSPSYHLYVASLCSDLDFDNDGIPNYWDTDSDGDGCPDAIEGGGSFTIADIQNDTLTGGVDEDGIPTMATASGQAIGTSQDSTQQAAACLTIAENDINQTPQDIPVAGNILTNDSDPTDDVQTVQSASFLNASGVETNLPLGTDTDVYDEAGTLAGSIILNTDGTYEFTPATGYTGTVPVDYVVVDSNGSTDTAILTIEVLPIPSTDGSNNDVIAQDDTNTTEQGATVTTPILANDSDPDNDVLSLVGAFGFDMNGDSIALTTTPQDVYDENGVLAGQASIDGSGNVIFTADNDFTGDVPVNYTATDGTDTDDAVLVITVEPADPNDNDTYANDDASTGIQGADQTGNIITNDNDPEADDQDIESILVDTNGDGTAEVITPVAGSPVDVYQDGVLIGTLEVDPETGDFTFAPETDFVGTAVIPYTTTDGVDTDEATLYVTVLPNENTTVAENDINQTPQDTPVAGNVLTNDTDEEGDSQTVQSATFLNAAGMETNLPLGTPTDIYDEAGILAGSITLNADGSYDFTPATDYTGEVPVEYVVVDDNGNPATDAATLSIEVMPVDDPAQNDPPIANDDTNTTEMDTDVSGNIIDPNDSDPEGDALTVTSALVDTDGDGMVDEPLTLSLPTPIYGTDEDGDTVLAGTITLHASGTYSFDPEPTFTGDIPVDYTISDGNGGTDDATLTITVEPDTGNNTYANDDTNSGDQGVDQSGNLITNDNDPEGDDQDVQSILVDTNGDGNPEVVTPMAGTPVDVYQDGVLIGTITISPTTGDYDWTPEDDFVGTAVIPYTVEDSNGATDAATLYLTTFPVNTIASEDDFNNTPFETPVSADVSTNDVDQEADNQTFALDGANGGMDPAEGTVTMNIDGSYTFTPATGFVGNVNVPYTTCDDDATNMACEDATLVISVLDVKRDYGDAPVAYPAVWHRAVTDSDDDNVLDGATDVWLGMNTSFEAAQQSNPTGTGDQYDDAITFGAGPGQFPLLAEPGTSYDVDIIVNSAQADLVFYGMWIDWDEDGIYDDFHTGSQVTASPATATVTITAPATVGNSVNVRLRADDDPFVATDFEGGKTNGEVEDFQALVVLPVKLTHFSGQASGCNTDLRWHAETEENFSHYEIERSGDGRLFSNIETIKGTGNASTGIWYTYTDETPSQYNYYRLKMVDLDGSFEYSKIINVDTDCSNDYKIELYPNPTSSNLGVINVKFYSKTDEAQIQIIDMQGRTVKQLTIGTVQDDLNSIQLDVTDLPPGTYHFNMIGGGTGSTKTFIITNE